jgi:hypothetical protein
MHDVVVKKNKYLDEGVMFISFSCDEVTTIDILEVLGFHMCLFDNLKHILVDAMVFLMIWF